MIGFIFSAVKIIILLGFLIFIHEGGHFLVAKLCKVKVNEFAIGFGPVIWKHRTQETKYALRLIPLGGFVSMEGEVENSDDKGAFCNASIPRRIAIVVAGAFVNIVFGLMVYFILMITIGTYGTNEVESILDGYVAQEVGIQSGDKIIEINNKKIKNKYDVTKSLNNSKNQTLNVVILREGNELELSMKPTEVQNSDKTISYYLGIVFRRAEDTISNRLYYALIETKDFSLSIVDNLKEMFTGGISVDQMMGPVGISQTVAQTSGLKEFIYMLALISLSLGVTNLLPIPALDGGKILILLIEAIRRKPLKEGTEASIQLVGFSILIALSLYVTYNDILRIF